MDSVIQNEVKWNQNEVAYNIVGLILQFQPELSIQFTLRAKNNILVD